MGRRGRLAARDPDVVHVDEPQEHPAVTGIGDDVRRGARCLDHDGVEELPVSQGEAGGFQTRRQFGGPAVDAAGNAAQALGAVVHGVHGSDDRQQDLRRADVGRGLLAANVLLPRLQGEPVRRAVLRVDGEADQPSGQIPLEAALDGHVRRMRPAVPEGDAEALGGADGDVSAPLPRRLEQRQSEEVRRHRHQRPLGMGFGRQGLEVAQRAGATRILLDQAEVVALGCSGAQVHDVHDEPQRPEAGRQHGEGLGQAVGVDDDPIRWTRGAAAHERDRFGHGGALVEQGGVGRVEPGEIGHHRLKVQEGLQPALADFGLVRRIRRVPRGALEHVAPDDTGRDGPRVAEADHGLGDRVAGGQPAELLEDLLLGGGGREAERAEAPHTSRNRGIDQRVE